MKTPIITSLCDSDFYKVTMAQAALHQMPGAMIKSRFVCRSKVDLRPYKDEIEEEINHLETLTFQQKELDHLSQIRFLKPDFISFLQNFRLHTDHITYGERDGNLSIEVEGAFVDKTWFEIPILGIVAEVYHRNINPNPDFNGAEKRLLEKCRLVKTACAENPDLAFRLMEFGTRRRFSGAWQRRVVEILKNEIPEQLFGTSNVLLAQDYGLRVLGTMAHEWLQAAQGSNVRLSESQRYAFELWAREYKGDLGIALSDIFGMDAFLEDFDLYFSKLFDGARHDSGCPHIWTDKLLAHYKKHLIDAKTKAAVYSDGLNFPKAISLWLKYESQIRTSFGIGTDLTCDIPGVDALQIVMKIVECNGYPTAKVSDSAGKTICDDQHFLNYLINSVIANKLKR